MSLSLNVIVIKEKRLITSWKIQLKRINAESADEIWLYYEFIIIFLELYNVDRSPNLSISIRFSPH